MVKRQETGTETEGDNERGPRQTLATHHSLRVCVCPSEVMTLTRDLQHTTGFRQGSITPRTHTHHPAGIKQALCFASDAQQHTQHRQ